MSKRKDIIIEKKKNDKSITNGVTFFKRKKTEVIEYEEIGIMHVCCEQMQKALTSYKNKYGNECEPLFYNKYLKQPHLVIPTHHYYEYGDTVCDYEEMKYCPFCGTKINGIVKLDDL